MKDLSASWVLENPSNGDPDNLKGPQVLPFYFAKLVFVIHGPILKIKFSMLIHSVQIHNSYYS